MSNKRTVARIANRHAHAVAFVLEPWGEIYRMPASANFDVIDEGEADGMLEVQVEKDRITVWGWVGSILSVFEDGRNPEPLKSLQQLHGAPAGQRQDRSQPEKLSTSRKRPVPNINNPPSSSA